MVNNVLEICSVAIVISFTTVMVVGSAAIVLGILSVVFGKDKDN